MLKIFIISFVTLFNCALALNRCAIAPRFTLTNVSFPNDFAKYDVKFVAFLKASCGFCRTQAIELGKLQDELKKTNYSNIGFVIVNSYQKTSVNRLDVFRNVTSIPVVQDHRKQDVWVKYGAETDDMFILDKCNRVVFRLQLPDSIVTNGKVKESIIKTFDTKQCGDACPKSQATTKRSNANMKKRLTTPATTKQTA